MRKNSRTSAGSQISLRERIVDNLELPKDLMLGAAIVTVTGRGTAVISNYKGILEYEDSFIRVQTKTCRIRITGVRLAIDYYTNEEMKITGSIDMIEYEDRDDVALCDQIFSRLCSCEADVICTGTVLKSVREPEYPDLEFKTV